MKDAVPGLLVSEFQIPEGQSQLAAVRPPSPRPPHQSRSSAPAIIDAQEPPRPLLDQQLTRFTSHDEAVVKAPSAGRSGFGAPGCASAPDPTGSRTRIARGTHHTWAFRAGRLSPELHKAYVECRDLLSPRSANQYFCPFPRPANDILSPGVPFACSRALQHPADVAVDDRVFVPEDDRGDRPAGSGLPSAVRGVLLISWNPSPCCRAALGHAAAASARR